MAARLTGFYRILPAVSRVFPNCHLLWIICNPGDYSVSVSRDFTGVPGVTGRIPGNGTFLLDYGFLVTSKSKAGQGI